MYFGNVEPSIRGAVAGPCAAITDTTSATEVALGGEMVNPSHRARTPDRE